MDLPLIYYKEYTPKAGPHASTPWDRLQAPGPGPRPPGPEPRLPWPGTSGASPRASEAPEGFPGIPEPASAAQEAEKL